MNRIEIREATPGGPIEVIGHAATFNEAYDVSGSFMETITRGAFKRTLAENPDVVLLVNHAGTPLARTTSGTLILTEDALGLAFRAELEPSDPDVQAVVPKLRRGDMTECSFAFRASSQVWSEDKTERTVRECSINRGDISLVGMAANPGATAGLRAETLTLEQRERIAERVGKRVCGPYAALGVQSEEPRGHATIAVPEPQKIVRSYIETAKAHRAKVGHKATATDGELLARAYQELAKARQLRGRSGSRARRARTQADLDRLGKAGMAWKRRDGLGYSFPCENEADVKSAVLAVNRARAAERPGIRKFIMRRAKALGCADLIPPTWEASGALEGEPGPRPGAYC